MAFHSYRERFRTHRLTHQKGTIFVLGPTASGKSSLSAQVGAHFHREVINGDSVQVYRGLEIGSAAPTEEERSLCEHHLYGVVPTGQRWTAATYLEAVRNLVGGDEVKSWIVCGGSGFYLQALLSGMDDLPPLSDQDKQSVFEEIQSIGWQQACARLHALGARFQHIHENDHYRIRRAWEILLQEKGQPESISRVESPFEVSKTLKIGLRWDKEALRKRVTLRTEQMLQAGFVEEVRGLIRGGYEDWPPLSSVGYLQVRGHLSGEIEKEELAASITQATMKLVKKQMTWFQKDEGIVWFSGEDPELKNKVIGHLESLI